MEKNLPSQTRSKAEEKFLVRKSQDENRGLNRHLNPLHTDEYLPTRINYIYQERVY